MIKRAISILVKSAMLSLIDKSATKFENNKSKVNLNITQVLVSVYNKIFKDKIKIKY